MLVGACCKFVIQKNWKSFLLPNSKSYMCAALYVPDDLLLVLFLAFGTFMALNFCRRL